MPHTIQSLIEQMTIEEKAALCTGATPWQTLSIERLGLAPITVSDGPHGVRRAVDLTSLITDSLPATCFPVAAALASTWNSDLLYQLGQTLGDECLVLGVDVLLGPGINIKRSPLCGRNFEYFSEDPLVAGELSASLIRGIQSKGVGTSLKHFAVNNQETLRFTISAVVDERTLHEIYLPPFAAASDAGVMTFMSAFNDLNGVPTSANRMTLTDILRGKLGFNGFVVSDSNSIGELVAHGHAADRT